MEIKTTQQILKDYDEEKDREGVYDEEKWVAVIDNILKDIFRCFS